jgi:hypothetical protein
MHLGGVLEALVGFTSIFAMWVGFTFLYLALPNARTRWTSALLGGFVAAVLWHGAQVLHVKFQVGMARYNKLYAGFAAIPILLAWIQVSWLTVLAGAELAFAHQSEPAYQHIARSKPSDHAFKEIVALRSILRIVVSVRDRREAARGGDIAIEPAFRRGRWRRCCTLLERVSWRLPATARKRVTCQARPRRDHGEERARRAQGHQRAGDVPPRGVDEDLVGWWRAWRRTEARPAPHARRARARAQRRSSRSLHCASATGIRT